MRKALATQLLIMPFYPLVFIPQALNSAGRDDPFGWVFLGAVFLLMIGMIFVVRDFSRAGRFLGRTAGSLRECSRGTINGTPSAPAGGCPASP